MQIFGQFWDKVKGLMRIWCWHYDAYVVLDGNTLIEDHLTYIHSDESTEEISDVTYYRIAQRNQMASSL